MSLETPSSSYIECERNCTFCFQPKKISFSAPSLSHDRKSPAFRKQHPDEMKRGKYCSKVVVVLIHQAVGLGVSATAARRQLIIASAAGDEARAGRRQDDEDVLSGIKSVRKGWGGGKAKPFLVFTRSVWRGRDGLRRQRQRCRPRGCSWAAAASPAGA